MPGLKVFKAEITRAILNERERTAKIAEKHGCPEAALEIRSARPPSFRIVHPSTMAKHPDLAERADVIRSGITAREAASGERLAFYDPARPVSPDTR